MQRERPPSRRRHELPREPHDSGRGAGDRAAPPTRGTRCGAWAAPSAMRCSGSARPARTSSRRIWTSPPRRPEQVQALFRRTVGVGLKHGTVGVLDRRRTLHEVTTFRRTLRPTGATRSLRSACLSRTISPAATSPSTPSPIIRSPTSGAIRSGGAGDLARGVVRAVGEPGERFREDYLRILRAVRFAARFDFAIDPPTWAAARGAVSGLAQLSAERVRDGVDQGTPHHAIGAAAGAALAGGRGGRDLASQARRKLLGG